MTRRRRTTAVQTVCAMFASVLAGIALTATPAAAQSGQVAGGAATGTRGAVEGQMSNQVVNNGAGTPKVDLPNASGFWAQRDFNVTDTTLRVWVPAVAWENSPANIWVCLRTSYANHQSGAAIAAQDDMRLRVAGILAGAGMTSTASSSPFDDELPDGSNPNEGAEQCVRATITTPAAGTNVGGTVPTSLRGRTRCNSCGNPGDGGFDYSDQFGPYNEGATVNTPFTWPRLIPQSGNDDYVVISSSGSVVPIIANDQDPLHQVVPGLHLYTLNASSADGQATCTLVNGGQAMNIVPAIDPGTGQPYESGICEYYYNSDEVDGYQASPGPIGPIQVYWNLLPKPQPVAAADNILVDAWYGASNTPASAGTDVDYTVNMLANDSDPLGGTLSIAVDNPTSANGGTVVDNGDGTAVYTPAEGFCGEDIFTYTLTAQPPPAAATLRTASGRVIIDVVCNTAPVAIDDTFTVVQGANVPAGTSVRPNDFDFQDPQSGFTYTVISPPSNASSFNLSAAGVVTYVNDGTPGITSDSFTYEVCDNHAAEGAQTDPATLPRCTQATATILILEAPQAAPTAVADTGQVEAWYSTDGLGHAQTSITVDLAANDSDTDGNLDPTTLSILSGPTPAQGVLTNNGDGTVTFEPTDGYAGLVTVVYQICDDPTAATPPAASALCASAPLLITVLGNTTPIGIADTATVPANDPGTVINVTFNDFDPNGDGVVVNSVDPASAQGGTVVNNNDGTVTYTPAAGFSGTDSFNYQLCDDHLAGADSTAVAINGSWPRCTSVTVTVEVVNSPPIADDDFATTPFQVPVDISIIGNDSDAEDGNTVPPLVTTVDPASQAGGTIVDNGDGTVTYTPPTGFCGLDTFGYTLTDSNGLTDTATVTVNVVCDEPPAAEDDSTNVAFQTPGTIDLTGNDSDPEDGTVTVDSVDAVSQEGGTVVDNGDGTATYTPPAGFCGLDQFDYVVTDTAGNLDTATVSINVTCINSDQDGDGIPDWVEIIICGTATCADGTEDTDGDGIPDYVEVIQCGTTTCINIEDNTDTDGDGIPDWVEIIVCGTPTCATGAEDSDGDGVPDWVEVIICGSTTCADSDTDSDGDGIPDWIEVIICGTPTCANPDDDSDGDGVPDWVEVIMCGSPTCATGDEDTDGDGVPDSIEIQICGTATCLDPATDSDGDGIPDYIEFLLCGSATCANGGEDTNNNGVPDWQEIQLCGSVGCVKDFLTNFDVGACTNTAPFTIPGTLDYDIPNGFRSNTKISIFMMSELLLVYQGPLPDTQKVTLSVPANTIPGNHKFMVVGVDDITGRVKVDGCFRKGELPAPVVKPMMQAPHPAGPGGGSTLVRTGTEAGPLVAAAAAMLALGAGLLLVVRRRRRGEA